MKKIMLYVVLIILAISMISVFSFTGCKPVTTAAEETAAEETAAEETAAAEETKAVAEEQLTFTLSCQFAANVLINRIIFGMDVAGEDLGVKVNFIAPESGTVPDQVNQLISAIAAKPDGIAILVTENVAFQDAIKTCNEQGIPWGTFNTGDPGVGPEQLFYVGAVHYDSGVAIAEKALKDFTPKRYLVVDPLPGHSALDLRLKGIQDVMAEAGIPGDFIDSTNEVAESVTRTKAYIIENPDTDCIFPIGVFQNKTTVDAIEELGKKAGQDIMVYPHDVESFTLDAIKDGRIAATSDQQMFLQGYLPVMYLYLFVKYGQIPPMVNATGPAIYDKSNIAKFEAIVNAVKERYGEG
ncbi:MAG: substrate-binding domain-containing protein [Actinobacteria bacterium]|nr:substrate-binding domain-containing protein [Actinomycetota bacterium]